MELLRKRAEIFQNDKIFCIWAAYIPFVFFVRADVVKELLKNSKLNDKSWVYEWIQPLMGEGHITSSFEKSKPRRKALVPCFHSDILRSFVPVFSNEAQKLVNYLQKEAKNDFTDIVEPVSLCAVDITCETLFGVTINALENEDLKSPESFSRASKIYMSKIISPWHWIEMIFRNTDAGKEFHYHCDELQKLTRKMVEEKKKRYLRGEKETQVRKCKALMELLLDGKELSEEEIEEEVNTFALAGHINTTATVRWALYLIGLYPDVQAKVHEEIDYVFGKDLQRPISDEDLSQLQYLDCVLKESSRLYPSVSLFARQVNEDTKINGYTIPKGASCVVYTYYLHRDPEIYPDPERFDPDRFSRENRIPEYAFVPFSVGPRNCIGFKYAEIESKIIVAQILRNFTVSSLDERDQIKLMLTPTLNPHIPVRIRIRSRLDRSY
ncbi:unnamed protein product [Larinioides sclopetarius]